MNLYPYQEEGAAFLAAHPRAMLTDRMGLGKTAQAIAAANLVQAKRPLVVCPASAVPNWHHEWAMWEGQAPLTVLSYSKLARVKQPRTRLPREDPDLVILDESHYCKSPSAKRTRAALGLARNAEWAWLLTGTPMPNDPTELWPAMKYLWPDVLEKLGIRNAFQWMHRFCEVRPTTYGPKPYAVKNGKVLRGILKNIMLRRTLDDVGLDLPPLRVDLFRLPRDKAAGDALTQYDALEASEQDYTSELRHVLGRAKAPAVAAQLIQELQDGEMDKVVVLYYHKAVRDILRDAFLRAGLSVCGFGGESPPDARTTAIRLFQEDPTFRVFLAQQTSAGTAITLTAASEIVLVEPDWSPENNKQAVARVHRIGQTQPCRARLFAISGTLDEAILATIAQKMRMQEEVGLA